MNTDITEEMWKVFEEAIYSASLQMLSVKKQDMMRKLEYTGVFIDDDADNLLDLLGAYNDI
jgi:hypothetical protein